jgi:two-component system, OmpR family, osmolarity sensor histidine kinase EnvZ
MRFAHRVAVRARRRGTMIEVTIDDDGPGIPIEQREEVFKPFFRLEGSRNPATGGVGLGMTIARDVVRGHGGDILLDDSPQGGLRVRVRLPV